MAAISPIRTVPVIEPPRAAAGAAEQGNFRSLVEGAIGKVEQYRQGAAQAVESFLSGEGGELHTTVLAAERAELALNLFLQARNKVVQAYQEIMRMQM
jgi:flagellar hook-basal body complex protein FliE